MLDIAKQKRYDFINQTFRTFGHGTLKTVRNLTDILFSAYDWQMIVTHE